MSAQGKKKTQPHGCAGVLLRRYNSVAILYHNYVLVNITLLEWFSHDDTLVIIFW